MKRSLAACSILFTFFSSACSATHFSVLPRGGKFKPDGDIAVSGDAGTVGVNASSSVEALVSWGRQRSGIRRDVDFGVAH
jgi:hypothetical protein